VTQEKTEAERRTEAAMLEKVCTVLWGTGWRLPLAEAEGYNERSVRRWANGVWNIPDDLWPKLKVRLQHHSDVARALMKKLPR